jgi:hypothetical protein
MRLCVWVSVYFDVLGRYSIEIKLNIINTRAHTHNVAMCIQCVFYMRVSMCKLLLRPSGLGVGGGGRWWLVRVEVYPKGSIMNTSDLATDVHTFDSLLQLQTSDNYLIKFVK